VKQREFIIVAIGAALAPTEQQAQEPGRTYRLGVLYGVPRDGDG
jgi:hypothetical protein